MRLDPCECGEMNTYVCSGGIVTWPLCPVRSAVGREAKDASPLS